MRAPRPTLRGCPTPSLSLALTLTPTLAPTLSTPSLAPTLSTPSLAPTLSTPTLAPTLRRSSGDREDAEG
eukprot:6674012-Prymnesium_polylepis.1